MVQNSVLPTFEEAPSSTPSSKQADGDQQVWQDMLENCSIPDYELAFVQTQEGEDEASAEDHENEDENLDHDSDFDDARVESDDEANAAASEHDYCEFDGDDDFAGGEFVEFEHEDVASHVTDLVSVSEDVEGDENGCDFLFDPSDEHEAEWNSNLIDEVNDPPRQSTQNPVRDDVLGFAQQMLVGKVHPRDKEVRRTQDWKRTKVNAQRVMAVRRAGLREIAECEPFEGFEVCSAFKALHADQRDKGGLQASDIKIPRNYREAMRSKQESFWKEVMDKEMAALMC
ncbi:hypothetical protein P3T76_012873 [Phytophthora citrophthora]|uniref:Uncharacterized protein n=1 Tax=Phytophthora citrophthora TaxID=4793 RepID=A0AAD9G3N9_9STRA|nr:hypothetical protein P3T76_012873 [Phytophthora citrophthora]